MLRGGGLAAARIPQQDDPPAAEGVSRGYVREVWDENIETPAGKLINGHYLRIPENLRRTHVFACSLHVPGVFGEVGSDLFKVIKRYQTQIIGVAVTALAAEFGPVLAPAVGALLTPIITPIIGPLFDELGRLLQSRTEVLLIAHQVTWSPPAQPVSVVIAFKKGSPLVMSQPVYTDTQTGKEILDPNDRRLRESSDPNDDDWAALCYPTFETGHYADPAVDRVFRIYAGPSEPPSNPMGFSARLASVAATRAVSWAAPGQGVHLIVPFMVGEDDGNVVGYVGAFLDEVLRVRPKAEGLISPHHDGEHRP